MHKISVFGLGKVGYTLATCLASAGNRVIGCDLQISVVEAVNAGSYNNGEPGVAERRRSLKSGILTATSVSEEAVSDTDVSMIVVPTPSNVLGGYSLRFVLDACRSIGEAIKKKQGHHTVALVSTVLPGASDDEVIPALESASGRRIGSGLSYCYNPSFIALGEVVKGLEQPDYVLVGEADPAAGDALAAIHHSMLTIDVPVERMSSVEAEIAKIACNTHETMRVAFANMLFAVCSEIPNANVDRITGALGYRMGQRFFKGAVPYGGPCWPRDNRALAVFMDLVGVPSIVPRTIDVSNAEHGVYVLRKVLEQTRRDDVVGLLGLAYKPGTAVIEASFGMELAAWLVRDGRRVIAWDPLALDAARVEFGDRIGYATTAEDCLRRSQVLIVINPMKELAGIDWSAGTHTTVMDPWRCLSDEAVRLVRAYIPMGRGRSSTGQPWPDSQLSAKLRLLNE